MDSYKVHQQAPPNIGGSKPRTGVGVEPFEFTSNGGGWKTLLRLIKRRKATFYEVIKYDERFRRSFLRFPQGAGPVLSPNPWLYEPKASHDVTVPDFLQVHRIWIKKYTFM